MVMNWLSQLEWFLCSHRSPCRWQLGLLQMEPSQKMNSPLHSRLVCKDVLSVAHWWGVLTGTRDPSEIGVSAASASNVRRRGGAGIWERPLSFLSISARLVLVRILLLMRGLRDEASVSAALRACTCPTTRSSPNGRRVPLCPASTMPLGPVGSGSRDAPSGES